MACEVELMHENKLTGQIKGSSKERKKNQYLILRANILQNGSAKARRQAGRLPPPGWCGGFSLHRSLIKDCWWRREDEEKNHPRGIMEQLFHVCSRTTYDQLELYGDASCRLLPYEVSLMENEVLHTSSALQETPSLIEYGVLCPKHIRH